MMMTASPSSPPTALWSGGLPDDLLASIFRRLAPPDLIRSSAVCHSWHSLISRTLRPPHLPWLLLSTQTATNDDKAICNFYSLSHQQNFSINVPLGGRRPWDHVVNSCGESLIVADDNSNLLLVKPLFGAGAAGFSLPPTATLPRVQAIHGGDDEECITGYHYSYPDVSGYKSWECDTYYFGKAVVLCASPSTYTIFVIDKLSDIGLVSAREGDREWKVWLSSGYGGRIVDVIYHDVMGGLLALDYSGIVRYCAESIQNIDMFVEPRRYFNFFRNATISDRLNFQSCGCKLVGLGCCCRRYLVQMSGDVLQVQRLGVDCGFKVYRLEKQSWVETKDLGDYSLFLDSTNCFSLSARFCPEVRANCIYFAHSHDPGIFQLEDGSVSFFHLKGHRSTEFIWFLPKLCAGNLEMKEEEDVNKQEAKASDPIHRREEKKRKKEENARKEAMVNISQGLDALFPSCPGSASSKETRTAATHYPRNGDKRTENKIREGTSGHGRY